MTEKGRKSANKNTKSRKKRRTSRSRSKDKHLRESCAQTQNFEEGVKEKVKVCKVNMERKQKASPESIHDSIDCSRLQQSSLVNSTRNLEQIILRKLANKTVEPNSEQIPQLNSELSSSLGDVISTTNSTMGKWQLSQNVGNSDTMRWQDCCTDPAEESQRMEKYKADRRQRYYELERKKTATNRYYAQI